MVRDNKCSWCEIPTFLDAFVSAADDVDLCDACLNTLSDSEILRETSLLEKMLNGPAISRHYPRIQQLLFKHPDDSAWALTFRPEAMTEKNECLAVKWLQLNVVNPKLYSVGPFARSESAIILRALFEWVKQGGLHSPYMPPLLSDFIKTSIRFDSTSQSEVLNFVRSWVKLNPGDEYTGLVYSTIISITSSEYDIRNAQQWYQKYKKSRFAWKVIFEWLNAAYRYSIEHRYAIAEAKKLLNFEEKRSEYALLAGSLVGVKADEETVAWAKEAYEQTKMPWILVRLLKRAPEQSLMTKAEECSEQWIESDCEEEMLYALLKASPGNQFAQKQTIAFAERHAGYEFEVCSFCGEASDYVDHMVREQNAFICSKCAISLREQPRALNTGKSVICSFCHVAQKELLGNYRHKICDECLEFANDVIRGDAIGQKFLKFVLTGGFSERLQDSIFSEETNECSFCVELKTNCSSLFPGSKSDICDACYDTYSKRTEAATTRPCACCQNKNWAIKCVGFTLCASCINSLSRNVEEYKIIGASTIEPTNCSMCNLKTAIISAGDVRLCPDCVCRVQSVLDEPKLKPKVGQNFLCRIAKAEREGYSVLVGNGSSGFLPTRAKLKRGLELSVQFVCWYNGRMLLKPRP